MGSDFTPLFLYILVAVVLAVGILVASALIDPGRGRGNPVKLMPYESGMDPVGDTRRRFDVRYHLIAIAFLLFDVELLFLYPWAVGQYSSGTPPIAVEAMAAQTDPMVTSALQAATEAGIPPAFRTTAFFGAMVFLAIVAAGYAYDWRKGVFEWR